MTGNEILEESQMFLMFDNFFERMPITYALEFSHFVLNIRSLRYSYSMAIRTSPSVQYITIMHIYVW